MREEEDKVALATTSEKIKYKDTTTNWDSIDNAEGEDNNDKEIADTEPTGEQQEEHSDFKMILDSLNHSR